MKKKNKKTAKVLNREQLLNAYQYHEMQFKECHKNLPKLQEHHLKRMGEIGEILNEMDGKV